MAGAKIRGVTIELSGDTSGFTKSLTNANKEIKNTQTQLSDVEKLLKLDPTNVDLLAQKQQLVTNAIGQSKDKLDTLNTALEQMKADGVDESSEAFMALQREVVATEQSMQTLSTESGTASTAMQGLAGDGDSASTALQGLADVGEPTSTALGSIGEAAAAVSEKAGEVAEKTKGISDAAGTLVGKLAEMGLGAITSADDLATLSAQTGISTDTLQKFQFASDMVDVSTDTLTTAFKKMKIQMDKHPETFEALGVSVTDADGNFRDLESVFYDTVGALSQIEDGTARDLASMDVFGKGADDLATIIDDGGATLKEYSQKAEDLGLILDEDTIKSLTSTGDQVDTLKAQAEATMTQLGAQIITEMGPTLEGLLGTIQDIIAWIGTLDGDTLTIIATVGIAIAAISPVASMISGITTAVQGVSSAISFLVANPMVAVIAAVVGAVTIIATKGEEIKAALQGVDDFLQNIFAKDWSEQFGIIGDVLNGFFATVEYIWTGIKDTFTGVIDFIQSIFKGDWEGAWEGVKNIFKGIWETFEGILKAPLNGMIGILNGLIDGLNWIIRGINSISVEIPDWVPFVGGNRIGFNLGEIGKLAYLAKGGILSSGSAIVGEAGPEMLTMTAGGRAVVQPLTNNTTNQNYGGVTLNVYATAGQSVQQLAQIIMDEIGDATRRQEASLA